MQHFRFNLNQESYTGETANWTEWDPAEDHFQQCT